MLSALARSLGLDPVRAETLMSEPVAPLDLGADSLLVRSDGTLKEKEASEAQVIIPQQSRPLGRGPIKATEDAPCAA